MSEAEDIIEYCIKSMYLNREFLLKNKGNLGAILAEKQGDELQGNIEELIKKSIEKWKRYKIQEESEETKDYLKTQVKIFNDSVHKSIELNALEVAVVDTPEFSRLRGIKQLGGVCYVYPGAVHTRFEHSIGVCHLAGKFIDRLKQKLIKYKNMSSKSGNANDTATKDTEEFCVRIEEAEEYCVRLAALCHDLGHGPFSHMFESLREKIVRKYNDEEDKCLEKISHEEISVLLFKHLLVNNMKVLSRFLTFGLNWQHVWMIEFIIEPGELDEEKTCEGVSAEEKKKKIKIKDTKAFLYEIVANKESGMDVDKWDYYARDCHYLGVTNEFDYERLMKLSSIVKRQHSDSQEVEWEYHIGFRKKEADNIYRMFRTRTVLYQKAYVHQVGDAVEMMISDALFEIRKVKILNVGKNAMSLTDIVVQFVNDPARKATMNLDAYIALKDSLLDIIDNHTDSNAIPSIVRAKEILANLKKRELYWCCKELVIPSEELELKECEFQAKCLRGKEYKGSDVCPKNEELSNYHFEIEAPKIAYSSEKPKDPAESVYFYSQEEEFMPSVLEVKVPVSYLHTPKTFYEYRVRLYCKDKKTRKRKAPEMEESYTEFLTNKFPKKKIKNE